MTEAISFTRVFLILAIGTLASNQFRLSSVVRQLNSKLEEGFELIENNENTTDSDWELVSINSYPEGVKYLPMKPVTMMRNQLELEGGTKAFYSSKEWAESILFWQKYASLNPVNLIDED